MMAAMMLPSLTPAGRAVAEVAERRDPRPGRSAVVPFATLVFRAALLDIPTDILASADVDGARPWQAIRYIVLPLLRPCTLVLGVLTLVYAFNHDEAIRSFERAAALDPQAAMPLWGIALALGPNINMDVDPAGGWLYVRNKADVGGRVKAGQVAVILDRWKNLQFQWDDACPDGQRIILLVILGGPSADLGGCLVERQ